MLVALRNVGVAQSIVNDPFAPAVAPDDAADTTIVDRFPAGVVAERAGHADSSSRGPSVSRVGQMGRVGQVSSNGCVAASIDAAWPWPWLRSAALVRVRDGAGRRSAAASAAH